MKKIFIQLAGTILLALPHLQLDSTYLDMGIIDGDTVAERVIRFRNTGDEPLQILNIFSECGCTSPSYPRGEVQPGEEQEIKVRFNPKNRRPGSFRKALRIKSNADNQRETIIIKGKIKN